MFVISHRNIIVPSVDGRMAFNLPKGYIGSVPQWVESTAYFKALLADGKVSVSMTAKDKELETATETAKASEKKARAKHKETVKQ